MALALESFVLQEQAMASKPWSVHPARRIPVGHSILIVPNALPPDIQGASATGSRTITLRQGEHAICTVFSNKEFATGWRRGNVYASSGSSNHLPADALLASFVLPSTVSGIMRCAQRAQKEFLSVPALRQLYCAFEEKNDTAACRAREQQNFSDACGEHSDHVLALMKTAHG